MGKLSSGAFNLRRGVNAVFGGLRGLSIDDELELLGELIGSVEKIMFFFGVVVVLIFIESRYTH